MNPIFLLVLYSVLPKTLSNCSYSSHFLLTIEIFTECILCFLVLQSGKYFYDVFDRLWKWWGTCWPRFFVERNKTNGGVYKILRETLNHCFTSQHVFQIVKQAWNHTKMFVHVGPSNRMLCWLILSATPTPLCPQNTLFMFPWKHLGGFHPVL